MTRTASHARSPPEAPGVAAATGAARTQIAGPRSSSTIAAWATGKTPDPRARTASSYGPSGVSLASSVPARRP
ncbi:MAG: hypothetical protein KF729_35300 [Sandaracinaceae bacterium]|nr:hypothetical protein [Sandaracinaceae bacterium]